MANIITSDKLRGGDKPGSDEEPRGETEIRPTGVAVVAARRCWGDADGGPSHWWGNRWISDRHAALLARYGLWHGNRILSLFHRSASRTGAVATPARARNGGDTAPAGAG